MNLHFQNSLDAFEIYSIILNKNKCNAWVQFSDINDILLHLNCPLCKIQRSRKVHLCCVPLKNAISKVNLILNFTLFWRWKMNLRMNKGNNLDILFKTTSCRNEWSSFFKCDMFSSTLNYLYLFLKNTLRNLGYRKIDFTIKVFIH